MTEQVLAAKGPVRDEARAKAKVEAEWVGRLRQDQAEIVFVQSVGIKNCILLDKHVIRKAALNVVHK